MDPVLFGVPLVALIIGLVETAKRVFHMPQDYAPWLALVLSFVFVMAWESTSWWPEAKPAAHAIVAVAVVFLTVTGGYEVFKPVIRP